VQEDFSSPEVTPDREQPPGQPIVIQPGSINASQGYGGVVLDRQSERSTLASTGGQAAYGAELYTS